jgi:hypothetical protein
MKKIIVLSILGTLVAGSLFAANNHRGNHMHEGKMMNHSNMNGKVSNMDVGNCTMNMEQASQMHKKVHEMLLQNKGLEKDQNIEILKQFQEHNISS